MKDNSSVNFKTGEAGAELIEVALLIAATLMVVLGIATMALSSFVEANTCATLSKIVEETQDVYNATHRLDEARAYANSQVFRLFNYGISAAPSAIYRAEPQIEMRQDVRTNKDVNYISISPPGTGAVIGEFRQGGPLVDQFGNEVAYGTGPIVFNPINIHFQTLNNVIYHIPNLNDHLAAIYRMIPTIASFSYKLQFLGAEFSRHTCNIPFYPDVITSVRERYAGDPNQPVLSVDDPDNDGVLTSGGDNCPNYSNATQADTDGDGVGDQCDSDSNSYLAREFQPAVDTCDSLQPAIGSFKESCGAFEGAIWDSTLCRCRCMTTEEFMDYHGGITSVKTTPDPEVVTRIGCNVTTLNGGQTTSCSLREYPTFDFPPELCVVCNLTSWAAAASEKVCTTPTSFPNPPTRVTTISEGGGTSSPTASPTRPPVITSGGDGPPIDGRTGQGYPTDVVKSLNAWLSDLGIAGFLPSINGVSPSNAPQWWTEANKTPDSPPPGFYAGWLCGYDYIPCRTQVAGDLETHPQSTGSVFDCLVPTNVVTLSSLGVTAANFEAARSNPALWQLPPLGLLKIAQVESNSAGGTTLCSASYNPAGPTTIAAAAAACAAPYVFDVNERTLMAVCSPDPSAAPSGCGAGFSGTTFATGCIDPITCETDAGGQLASTGCVCLSPGTFDANGVCQNGGGVCTMWLGGANLRGCTGTVANAVPMGGDMWACNSGNALNIAPNKYLCPNSPLQASFCMVTGVPQGNCNLTSPMVAPAGAGCVGTTGLTLCSCLNGGSVFTDQSGGRVGCD